MLVKNSKWEAPSVAFFIALNMEKVLGLWPMLMVTCIDVSHFFPLTLLRSRYRWSGSGSGGRHGVSRWLLSFGDPYPLPSHHWTVRHLLFFLINTRPHTPAHTNTFPSHNLPSYSTTRSLLMDSFFLSFFCHQADTLIFQMTEPIFCLITQHVIHVPAVCSIPLTSNGWHRLLSATPSGSQGFIITGTF